MNAVRAGNTRRQCRCRTPTTPKSDDVVAQLSNNIYLSGFGALQCRHSRLRRLPHLGNQRTPVSVLIAVNMAADEHEAIHSESTPLIQNTETQGTPTRLPISQARKTYILLLTSLFVLSLGIGDEIINPAQTRVFEAIYCRRFYEKHDPSVIAPGYHDGWWDDESRQGVLLGIQERWCKVPEVQGDVATVKLYEQGLSCIGSLLLAIPWGYFADYYGRKPLAIMLAFAFFFRAVWIQIVAYFWQTFDPHWMWMAALHSFFGGSSPVGNAILFTILSDITTEVER